jgi:hypothetical protein
MRKEIGWTRELLSLNLASARLTKNKLEGRDLVSHVVNVREVVKVVDKRQS